MEPIPNDPMNPHLQDIQDLRDEIDILSQRWLGNRGWKYTCANPTSCWYWEKTVGGITYRLSEHDAIELQARLSGCPECGSDEVYYENPRTGCGGYACCGCGHELTEEQGKAYASSVNGGNR